MVKDTSMKHEPEVFVLKCPDHIKPFRESNHDTVCIDAEISTAIHYLWSMGVITLGCCSGHGKMKPSVIIHSGYTDEDIKKIKQYLIDATTPTPGWVIFQWRNELKEV